MSSFGITPTYRPSTHHHTPPVSEHEINQFRIEKGQCPKCGLQTHKLRSSLIRGKKSIPLTNDNVLSGRCLDCNPMRTTSPAATAAPPPGRARCRLRWLRRRAERKRSPLRKRENDVEEWGCVRGRVEGRRKGRTRNLLVCKW
mmetsp:Transcript_31831/g.57624  ORF Transcript_31831/g.57624 Transcript_31831/m.57624 type:complete len:143 (-) Transcript_31831:7-435(-)